MKTIKLLITLGVLVTSIGSKAQFTLEHTYPDASVNLYMVDLEVAGKKYIQVKRYSLYQVSSPSQIDRRVILYNLDHTVYKNIDLNFIPPQYTVNPEGDTSWYFNPDILYVSQNLFNTDDKVELMLTYNSGTQSNPNSIFTAIINENSDELFREPFYLPLVRMNIPQAFRPIYNTPQGTKMILSKVVNNATLYEYDARVYGLAGTLATGTDQMPVPDNGNEADMSLMLLPNPSTSVTKIQYTLPFGETAGIIGIYSPTGQLLRSLPVTSQTNFVELTDTDLAAGMYTVRLTCNNQYIAEKMLRVD